MVRGDINELLMISYATCSSLSCRSQHSGSRLVSRHRGLRQCCLVANDVVPCHLHARPSCLKAIYRSQSAFRSPPRPSPAAKRSVSAHRIHETRMSGARRKPQFSASCRFSFCNPPFRCHLLLFQIAQFRVFIAKFRSSVSHRSRSIRCFLFAFRYICLYCQKQFSFSLFSYCLYQQSPNTIK